MAAPKRKICVRCQKSKPLDFFAVSPSPAFMDKHIDVCCECVDRHLERNGWDWDLMDKYCQYADIPFEPKIFTQYVDTSDHGEVWKSYAEFYLSQKDIYGEFGWKDYYEAYLELKEKGLVNSVCPLLSEEDLKELRQKWGNNYSEEALNYLENLYRGLTMTQNINGALSTDQAFKLCKLSYLIDENIRNGLDVDKPLASYEKLVKVGNFTPANAKDAGDFESIGELAHWLEKKGWKNRFYDDATRDVVDETMKNIQAYNRHLYTDESGIGEEITARIQSLKTANDLENRYNIADLTGAEADSYADAGFDWEDMEEEEDFEVELEGEMV